MAKKRIQGGTLSNVPPCQVDLICRERDNTKFLLGVESVNAINDGGLGIRYHAGPGRGLVQWQPAGTVRPVLSLEVTHPVAPILTLPRLNDGDHLKRMTSN